jgi:hypothetical protein
MDDTTVKYLQKELEELQSKLNAQEDVGNSSCNNNYCLTLY